MSPALATVTSPIAHIPSLPVITQWNNPLPESFRVLDGRRIYLTTESNRILEMHPNGVRGVEQYTEYCLLTILLYHINVSLGSSWGQDKGHSGFDGQLGRDGRLNSLHVLRGNTTGLYLCMDDHSVPYQSKTFSPEHCTFNHEQDGEFTESYYRKVNNSKWYIGLNRDGSVRCGNVTRRTQKSARFYMSSEDGVDQNPPKPYKPFRKPCCNSNKCSRKRGDKCKSRKSKRWCKRKRRQFFKLSLKELKRYYKKCILEKEKIRQKEKRRHCKDR